MVKEEKMKEGERDRPDNKKKIPTHSQQTIYITVKNNGNYIIDCSQNKKIR